MCVYIYTVIYMYIYEAVCIYTYILPHYANVVWLTWHPLLLEEGRASSRLVVPLVLSPQKLQPYIQATLSAPKSFYTHTKRKS